MAGKLANFSGLDQRLLPDDVLNALARYEKEAFSAHEALRELHTAANEADTSLDSNNPHKKTLGKVLHDTGTKLDEVMGVIEKLQNDLRAALAKVPGRS